MPRKARIDALGALHHLIVRENLGFYWILSQLVESNEPMDAP